MYKLTLADTMAIRNALGVSFVSRGEDSYMKLILNDNQETLHTLPCDRVLKIYSALLHERITECHAYCTALAYNPVWKSVGWYVRKGDIIRLDWNANGLQNGYLKRAQLPDGDRLNIDTLTIVVIRGTREIHFPFATIICPDNTSRMIKTRVS